MRVPAEMFKDLEHMSHLSESSVFALETEVISVYNRDDEIIVFSDEDEIFEEELDFYHD